MRPNDHPVILLVEDNRDDELLTVRALKACHVKNQLVVARDGVEAIDQLLDATKPLPRLVLLDLKLPRVDGLEVLRRVRAEARTRLVPVVVLTSSDETSDIQRSYELGANSYIRKPVDFDQFAHAVRDLGLYWLLINEPPPLRTGVGP